MSIQMIMLKALLLIALLTNSCEDPMQEVDPDILNRNCPSGREDFIVDQDILYFDDYIGANGETLHDFLTRMVLESGDTLSDFKYCPCDSFLIQLSVNPNVDPNERQKVVKSKGEDEEFKWGQNRAFRLGPKDAISLAPLLDLSDPEVPTYPAGQNRVVEVAIIDSGIDFNHPDLEDYLWKRTGSTDALPDSVGFDFSNDSWRPVDSTGHGTHVAGIVTHSTSNLEAQVRIMNLKITQDSTADLFSALCALRFALKNEIPVVNMSWGYYAESPDEIFETIVQEASNTIFVASAGNDGLNTDDCMHWPSGFSKSFPNVISVGSIGNLGELSGVPEEDQQHISSFSNYGPSTVQVLAPGENIFSTLPNNSCGNKTGTSMSAPYLSRLAAIELISNPGSNPESIFQAIFDNYLNRIPGLEEKIGWSGYVSGSNPCSPGN